MLWLHSGRRLKLRRNNIIDQKTILLSVVIPTTQETETTLFEEALRSLSEIPNLEIICIDQKEASTRAKRLNLGFSRAKGTMILFHHPRSLIQKKGLEHLIKIHDQKFWGGFHHQFDYHHPLLRFTSWYSNSIRGRIRGILYLDHCIFFHRSLWTSDLPDVEIFEDTILSKNLLSHSKPLILPYTSTTSAIRFIKKGVFFQALINQLTKVFFYIGISHHKINKIYESGLNLNTKVKS